MKSKRRNSQLPTAAISSEFENVRLPDKRLIKRLASIADTLQAAPDKSFPEAAADDAELEGIYRFLNNDGVSFEHLVGAHAQQTVGRVEASGTVLVLHDTTEMEFKGEADREGLGHLRRKSKGFLLHLSLAVSAEGLREPLGVLAARPHVRTAFRKKSYKGQKLSGWDLSKVGDRESSKWLQSVQQVEQLVSHRASLIHVMDREADAYPLLSTMASNGWRFVVRVAKDRSVLTEADEDPVRLSQALQDAQDLMSVEVPIGRRKTTTIPARRRGFRARDERTAKLTVSAMTVELRRPRYLPGLPETLSVNLVRVREVDTPDDCDPVDWILVTNEPIESREQVLQVVLHYRTRWLIEEYFKAIKTGCAYETRQLESYQALLRALAIFLPIAWKMLHMRHLARNAPAEPATRVLTASQVKVLRACGKRRMPSHPTVRDALLAIAALGGHLSHNGEPGWLVLARGLRQLINLDVGYALGRNEHEYAGICDQ
jgi:hypothetical protein